MTRITPRIWADMIGLALIWGGSFLAIRIALDEIPVFSSVAHRVLWAALALWLVVLVLRQPVPRDLRIWGAFLVMGCLNNVIPFSLMAWGQLHIETGLTAILNAATAIWGVLVAAAVFADERLTTRRLIGVLTGFLGVSVAIGLDAFASFDLASLAQLAVIGGTVSYALAGSWARARLKGISPVVSAAGMLTGSSLIMLPLARAMDGPLPLAMAPDTLAAVAYYALMSTALAYLLYYRILAAAGAGNLLLVTLMIAPVAIVLGAVVRGEALGANAYLGFALLALGLLILNGRLGHVGRKSRPT
ncbi:DMT family transporter [Kangsaoukella pontilimi]|nr:DMT family transporter [Kangsaoukella pontilimi]